LILWKSSQVTQESQCFRRMLSAASLPSCCPSVSSSIMSRCGRFSFAESNIEGVIHLCAKVSTSGVSTTTSCLRFENQPPSDVNASHLIPAPSEIDVALVTTQVSRGVRSCLSTTVGGPNKHGAFRVMNKNTYVGAANATMHNDSVARACVINMLM
jgi:hypothetical protein